MTSPDRELLTQTAARELLERAGQIDADSTTIDTLRAAAREAGISEAAFDAALLEMRGKLAFQPTTQPPRWRKRRVFAIVTAAFVMAAAVFVIIPARVAVPPTDRLAGTIERNIPVRCLSMEQ